MISEKALWNSNTTKRTYSNPSLKGNDNEEEEEEEGISGREYLCGGLVFQVLPQLLYRAHIFCKLQICTMVFCSINFWLTAKQN